MTPRKPPEERLITPYTREQKIECLTVVAFYNGRTSAAHRELRARGYDTLARQLLDKWKVTHADIYEDCISRLDEASIPEIDRVMRTNLHIQARGNEIILDSLEDMDPKDVSTAVRNAAVGFGITAEKSQLFKGLPTDIVDHKEPTVVLEFLNELAAEARRLHGDVESTAVEIESVEELEEAS